MERQLASLERKIDDLLASVDTAEMGRKPQEGADTDASTDGHGHGGKGSGGREG